MFMPEVPCINRLENWKVNRGNYVFTPVRRRNTNLAEVRPKQQVAAFDLALKSQGKLRSRP